MQTITKTKMRPLTLTLQILVILFSLLLTYQILCFTLNTTHPLLVVSSSSMSPTLQVGDVIVIQNTQDIHINDIIVFHTPKITPEQEDQLIVHRIINQTQINGTTYYQTKGDNNNVPDEWYDYRGSNYTQNKMLSKHLIVGKVILRIPYLGWLLLSPIVSFSVLCICLLAVFAITLISQKIKKPRKQPKEKRKNFFAKIK